MTDSGLRPALIKKMIILLVPVMAGWESGIFPVTGAPALRLHCRNPAGSKEESRARGPLARVGFAFPRHEGNLFTIRVYI